MLILFDIDGTLISTGGAGIAAMGDAGRELHGAAFSVEGIPFAGRLDPLIITDLLLAHGVSPGRDAAAAFRAAYLRHLPARLARNGTECRSLPGVTGLVDALADRPGVTLGLLTGNFAETGSLKLRACGIDPGRFAIHVWGDDSPHDPPRRDHLPPVGMRRYQDRHGESIHASKVWIIGDTPHDVACAAAHGCKSLAVATGRYRTEELHKAGATEAVQDLTQTSMIMDTLLANPRA